jgi:hypothetical protein
MVSKSPHLFAKATGMATSWYGFPLAPILPCYSDAGSRNNDVRLARYTDPEQPATGKRNLEQ